MHIDYKILNENDFCISNWSGGKTTQLYIFPEKKDYADRDFGWRISSATVDVAESDFTPLKGYMRHIMVLDGNMKLTHEGHHEIKLNKYEKDYFNGNWNTKSVGKCTDYNLMLSKDYSGHINPINALDTLSLKKDMLKENKIVSLGYFALKNMTLDIKNKDDKVLFSLSIPKNNYIVFNNLHEIETELLFQFMQLSNMEDNVVCISNIIYKEKS